MPHQFSPGSLLDDLQRLEQFCIDSQNFGTLIFVQSAKPLNMPGKRNVDVKAPGRTQRSDAIFGHLLF